MKTGILSCTEFSRTELFISFFSWLLFVEFIIYKYYQAQNELYDEQELNSIENISVENGWSFIGRPKDVSDHEWTTWKFFINTTWFYLLIHSVISEFIRRTCFYYLKYWYIAISLLFVSISMGLEEVFIILFQPIVYMGVIFTGGQKICVWVISIIILCLFDTYRETSMMWSNFSILEEQVYMMVFGFAWITLRCISFSLDYIDRNVKGHKLSNIEEAIDMLSYVLYLPVMFTGPVLLYEEFEKSFHVLNVNLSPKIRRFLWDILKFQIYTFVMDVTLHYIYFLAISHYEELLIRLPTFARCGSIMYMVSQFHLKYVVMYGTTSAIARLDNIDGPPIPRCLLRIRGSQLWKHFDVGLYRFLVKHIHKPFLRYLTSKYNFYERVNKSISALITFSFIFLWHGTFWLIFYWCEINYICLMIEYWSASISKTETYKWFKNKFLKSEAVERRFIVLLNVPLIFISISANVHFISNTGVGNIYFENFKNPSLSMFLLFCYIMYCFSHVCIGLSDYPPRKAKS